MKPTILQDNLDNSDVRANLFGCSHAAVLFGEHPFESAADYWIRKYNRTTVEETPAMRRGKELEPAIISWFAKELGVNITTHLPAVRYEHLVCVPDGMIDSQNVIVSVKTTALRDLEEPERYWWWQVQGELLLHEAEKAYIVWLDGRLLLDWAEVDADHDAQQRLFNQSAAFMQSVQEGVIPDWVETEARHMIARYPSPDQPLDVDETVMDKVTEYWSLKMEADRYKKAADEMRDELFRVAGDHDALLYDGKEIAALRPRKVPARLDHGALETFLEPHGLSLDNFKGEPSTTRALTIPKKIKAAIEQGAT